MDQYKQLEWSWKKYEEEKKKDPRNLNFENIADRDPLLRTLNEVHLCVFPSEEKYRYLKTPEEILANSFDSHGLIREVADPRKNVIKRLKIANELVKDYRYSSELNAKEQMLIINTLKINSEYNPKITKNFKKPIIKKTLNPAVVEKWNAEIIHFNKCAEIYYYRHISKFNNLIRSDLKDFLHNRWNSLECIISEQKYQVITMLLRKKSWTQSTAITAQFVNEFSQTFVKERYSIPHNFFPPLHRYSIERLKQYNVKYEDIQINEKFNIRMSQSVLTKLFADESEFSIAFTNSSDKTCFKTYETVPAKTVNIKEALEEVVRKILITNIEWCNINQIDLPSSDRSDFNPQKIDEVMKNIYLGFKRKNGNNINSSLYELSKNESKLLLLISNEAFYKDNKLINISIKLEYQTKFGAEKMTKEELLKEWINQILTNDSKTLRFRIDSKSMEILSISEVTLEDIENELKEEYSFDANDAFEVFYNMLNMIKNLPHGDYLIQARVEDKFYIYKENEQAKLIFTTDNITIASTFNRKWIPIDNNFPTYIHLNLKIAPCCFRFLKGKISKSYKTAVKKISRIQHLKKETRKKSKAGKSKKKKARKKKISMLKNNE